jgi:hypothetical protein
MNEAQTVPVAADPESIAIDRTGWPRGPWDDEVDRYEFRTQVGYPGLIHRNLVGALCGYVGVPPGHPAHGRSWRSEDNYERGPDGTIDYEREKLNPLNGLDVHGGITYAEKCQPAAGESDDVWWLGFDCSHAWDLSPGIHKLPPPRARDGLLLGRVNTYRTRAFVEAEAECLAAQLKTMAGR